MSEVLVFLDMVLHLSDTINSDHYENLKCHVMSSRFLDCISLFEVT